MKSRIKNNKVVKWLEKYSLLVFLIIIIAIPIIVAAFIDLPFFDNFSGSNDGWLGFWGGYLGSISAIFGVYWQMVQQNKQWKEDIKREKREKYVEKRPFVTMSINYGDIDNTISSAYFTTEFVKERNLLMHVGKWKTFILRICNLSSSTLYSVRIQLEFSQRGTEFVYINKIVGNKECQIISNNIYSAFDNELEEGYEYLPTTIKVFFYTEKREKSINIFKNESISDKKYISLNPLKKDSKIGYPLDKEYYEIDDSQVFNGKIRTPMFDKYFVESAKATDIKPAD